MIPKMKLSFSYGKAAKDRKILELVNAGENPLEFDGNVEHHHPISVELYEAQKGMVWWTVAAQSEGWGNSARHMAVVPSHTHPGGWDWHTHPLMSVVDEETVLK